ncbi:hypothetical protein PAEVO_57290 [Paenibacillus sp. GM2FR]|uniref:hypothetical protein n=1 Tax=Paenibacillus sp. GM2FR TaxID=2059268 RepID=UPI000C27E59F|nr:hypothetical protein [Paenibacillus sp. GM2FR]PJN50683.1 hypothetical protein PAEVO_57290 [Paenibacillus sp. GM2FR]
MRASDLKRFKQKFTGMDYSIIALAAVRVLVTHRHNQCKGRNNRLFGWVLVITYGIFELLMILATMDDKDVDGLYSASIVWGVIILIPAIIMLLIAKKEEKKFNRLLQFYSNAILQRGLVQIEHIAQEAGQTPAHAVRDITFMFERRMLPSGKLDNGVVIIPSLKRRSQSPLQGEFVSRSGQRVQYSLGDVRTPITRNEAAPDPGPKSVECPGCGARSVVTHLEKKECEYCGSVIVA